MKSHLSHWEANGYSDGLKKEYTSSKSNVRRHESRSDGVNSVKEKGKERVFAVIVNVCLFDKLYFLLLCVENKYVF